MRCDHEGNTSDSSCFDQQLADLIGKVVIQRAGWFVSEEHLGTTYQSASDGRALNLSAGQLVGATVDAVGEAQCLDQLSGLCRSKGWAAEPQGQLHVFQHREFIQQATELRDVSDAPQAPLCSLTAGQLIQIDSIHRHEATGGLKKASQDAEQRGLARATWAHHSDALRRRNAQTELDQHRSLFTPLRVDTSANNDRLTVQGACQLPQLSGQKLMASQVR